jgi:alpha-ribazole phosphatase
MIKIALIRHSKTKGNLEKRYIGVTDEELCAEGIALVKSKEFPKVETVYCSPLARCLQTARLIYKDITPVINKDLRECNFGLFENKNYIDLKEDIHYKKWIDSNGTIGFPSGETTEAFKARCIVAFDKIVEELIQKEIEKAAIIVHGGTIMAILDKYSTPHKDFFEWQVGNCEGFIINLEKEIWINSDKKVTVLELI